MNEKLNEIDRELRRMDNLAKWIIPFFLLFVITAPFLFTRSFSIIDFSTTGQIGDTIGGITSPIIGLLSAFLIFFSFRAQIKANKYQMEAILDERNRINIENESRFFEVLLSELQKSIKDSDLQQSLSNARALFSQFDQITLYHNPKEEIQKKLKEEFNKKQNGLSIFMKYLQLLMIFKNKIEKNIAIDEFEKNFVLSNLKYIYLQVFDTEIKQFIWEYNRLQKNNKTLPEQLVFIVEKNCVPINDFISRILIS